LRRFLIASRKPIVGAIVIIALAVGLQLWRSLNHPDHDRVYRIGYGLDFPYHFQGADGKPAGLAVDMVAEAARRRGIKLEWRTPATAGMTPIQNGEIDLWVLLTIRPERRSLVHLTEPYLIAETCFLVPQSAGARSVQDFAHARISMLDFDAIRRGLRSILPEAVIVPSGSTAEAVAAVREGRSDAAYLDQYPATAVLLTEAQSQPLLMLSSGAAPTQMGIASSFATQRIADELRDEMRSVASGESLRGLIQRWGLFSSRSTDAIAEVEDERRWNRFLSAGAAISLAVAMIVALLAYRLRRERNVAEARKAALEESQQKLKLIGDNTGDVIWILDAAKGCFSYVSPSVTRLRGYAPEEVLRQGLEQALTPESYRRMKETIAGRLAAFMAGDESARVETIENVQQPRKDGSLVTTEVVTTLLKGRDGKVREILGVSRDVTQRIRAAEERRNLEQQLQQAQRLESIGRLAGGIAHDFNNLLTVINGYSQILLAGSRPGDPNGKRLEHIHKAGLRAAGLTQQLLAFSRRQVIAPRSLNLNSVVSEVLGMLHSILGEDIHIDTALAADLGTALVDPDQMHQVIMNLAVNARDAMPHGGQLLLETQNVDLGKDYQERHAEMVPGRYILLAVSDTGEGMDAVTQQSIFEPFFTTKEQGRGTGLGLSTVHGIVRQSGGWIWVYSEPGKGSTFKIYLPRVDVSNGRTEAPAAQPQPTAGAETILLVEDQTDVCQFAVDVLTGLGYRVLAASSAEDAIQLADRQAGGIDLLLTDVVLPKMNGPQLAERMQSERPEIKVLYTSGYTDNVVVHRGALVPGFPYLPKPFTFESLAAKVREVMGHR
jgi:PAS domain S-box-containing protein